MPAPLQGYQSHFLSAPDGLKLHVRDYNSAANRALPVVCLAGLSRNSVDFDVLATALANGSAGPPRRVVALDYRGRGLSEYDRDWRNYNVAVESADILAVLTALGIGEAAFVGTSRGGIHIMALAAQRPGLIKAAVLNDIGPVLEARGLARIRGYIGKLPMPGSWPDAVDLLKRINNAQFSGLSEADWEIFARTTFQETGGKFSGSYDPKLMNTLKNIDLEAALPTMWPQFAGLNHAPMLVLRGENSDLLSNATVHEMQERHPDCQAFVVTGQGHAPLLVDAPSLERIARFIATLPAN